MNPLHPLPRYDMTPLPCHPAPSRPHPTPAPHRVGALLAAFVANLLAAPLLAAPPQSGQKPGEEHGAGAVEVDTAAITPPGPAVADTLDRTAADSIRAMALPGLTVSTAAPRTAASSARFGAQRLRLQAASTSADLLRVVPGLAVAQHGGGGKADQYLIRGFDADHGTDLALFVEGIPVNMVSHAHGQGYADLNHVIPETVERVEVFKGPYFAEYGNLSTAGTTELRLRESFDGSFVQAESGSFDTRRILGVWSPDASRVRGFAAVSASTTDGPFLDPQGFDRLNATTRWSLATGAGSSLTLIGQAYDATWNASGQIPLRAVRDGSLDRFGAIDPTEGGDTRRLDGALRWQWRRGESALLAQLWAARYELDLWSNFTFRLNDPEGGDGIVQRDRRDLWGGRIRAARSLGPGVLSAGLDLRVDDADVLLGAQRDRIPGAVTVDSGLRERNVGLWVQQEVAIDRWARVVLGLRHDRFDWRVADRTGDGPAGTAQRDITLPKASLIVTPTGSSDLQLFLNYGRGFHGNDARAVVSDPSATVLAAARGWEAGALRRFGSELEVTFAWWRLDLDGELVWVGDEGVTELSGPTRRQGPELDLTWTPRSDVVFEAGVTHTAADYRDSDDIVARAPRWSVRTALGVRDLAGWSGTLKGRSLRDIPLEESGTFRGEEVTVFDLVLRRAIGADLEVGFQVENLFDSDVNEAQTWFASRLPGEPGAGIEDNHFTPGVPRSLRLSLRWSY